MQAALIVALCCTVALLVVTAYFFLGALPLLILRHDTPLDSRFVRGFFNTYYLAAMSMASATAASYAFAGVPGLAAGAAALALLAAGLRRKIIPMMDSLRVRLDAETTTAVAAFRRVHVAAILVNLVQLVLIVWGLTTLPLR